METPEDELVIDYVPIKFEKYITPTEEQAFLPTVYTTEADEHIFKM